ncbi:hypothetical protein [Clostridium thermarum]|uniref:hypothetical protein n=1 Tax=Clostridium thermarum TaxID=1716543 RepID=UPI0013D87007|nr:hypothetical protein [Clostridium thermarum]
MYDKDIILEMVEGLEENGEIRMTDGLREIYIQSFDEDGEVIYVSNNNKEFEEAEDAIQWAINQFGGVENIEEWE